MSFVTKGEDDLDQKDDLKKDEDIKKGKDIGNYD